MIIFYSLPAPYALVQEILLVRFRNLKECIKGGNCTILNIQIASGPNRELKMSIKMIIFGSYTALSSKSVMICIQYPQDPLNGRFGGKSKYFKWILYSIFIKIHILNICWLLNNDQILLILCSEVFLCYKRVPCKSTK